MSKFNPIFSLGGRIMIALVFLISGLSKITAIEGMQGYMEAMGVPGIMIYPTILLEVGGAVAIIVGYQTRIVALLLAGFSIISAALFHADFADQTQFVMFMKNIAMAGGFLFLARHGAGELSFDNRGQTSAS